jgi:hypothetical protein
MNKTEKIDKTHQKKSTFPLWVLLLIILIIVIFGISLIFLITKEEIPLQQKIGFHFY